MGRAMIVIQCESDRQKAITWASKAPLQTRIEFKASKRTLPQNDRMWAMLTDIATQLEWHGVKLNTDDWKLMFLDALKGEVRAVPNLEGNGFVNLGRSTSDLAKEEMSDLIELIFKFGAEHDVIFNEQDSSEPPAQSGKEDKAGGDLPPSDSPPADILPRYAIDLLETVAFYDDDVTAQETVKKVHARYAGEYFKGAPDTLRATAKAILDTVNQVIKREIAFEDAKATIDGILDI